MARTKKALQHKKPHMKRPDGDNLEKYLNDALFGVLWPDDSHIAYMVRTKTFINAMEGETIVTVYQLPAEDFTPEKITQILAKELEIHDEEPPR